MQKNNMILPAILSIILLLMITIGVSYAYFTANITGGEDSTTITVKGGKMVITFSGGSHVDVDNMAPGNTPFRTKTFTVTGFNNTNISMGYKISLVVESNTFSENAIQYKMISTNTGDSGKVATPINVFTNIRSGAGTYPLGYGSFTVPTDTDKVHTYNLELYFPNEDYDQIEDQNKQIKAHVIVENFDYNNIPYDEGQGINKPVLFAGMTPVKWDDSFDEIETAEYDSEWYDYNAKKWANAKTADGSYWVWIPRYAYRMTAGYHSSETGTIDIKFLREETNINVGNTTIETTGYNPGVKDTSMHHFLHPAFDVEGAELGFWVAKFEPTAAEGVVTITGDCDATDNVSTKTVKIIPSATSWRCINNSNAFDATLNMKTNPVYGWEPEEVDPHMLTNVEWGAVTYLSKSVYGAILRKYGITPFISIALIAPELALMLQVKKHA